MCEIAPDVVREIVKENESLTADKERLEAEVEKLTEDIYANMEYSTETLTKLAHRCSQAEAEVKRLSPYQDRSVKDEAFQKLKADKEAMQKRNRLLIDRVVEFNPCKGIQLDDTSYSGCTATDGDCPECGR